MSRNTVAVTITVTANPDDLDLACEHMPAGHRLTEVVREAVVARLDECYVGPVGACVRLDVDVDNSTANLVEVPDVSPEADGYTALLSRLAVVRAFHDDNADPDDPDDPDTAAAEAIDEAVEMLRTHALPEDHPQAIR